MAKLTEKQELFAIRYVENGGIAIDAYKEVYDVKEDASMSQLYCNASRVANNDKVSIRIKELKMDKFRGKIISIEERKEVLSSLATDGDLKAMDILNKMEGIYIDKIEQNTKLKVEPITFSEIK